MVIYLGSTSAALSVYIRHDLGVPPEVSIYKTSQSLSNHIASELI